jgi:DNA mismatch repair protein MutS2
MTNHTQKLLDFPRIKNSLKSEILSPLGEEKIDAMGKMEYPHLMETLDLLDALIREIQFSRFPVSSLPDIRISLNRSRKKDSIVEIPEFLEISVFLQELNKIKNYFLERESALLKEIGKKIPFPEGLFSRLQEILDPEGNIRDKASPGLQEIRKKMQEYRGEIEDKLNRILENPRNQTFIQDNIITVKDGRWVIPVKKDFKGRIPGLVITSSATGETIFLEPSPVVELNNNFTRQKGEEKREILRILKKLTTSLRNILDQWEEILEQVGEIELLLAKAMYAVKIEAVRPAINREGQWDLKQARHPLLERPVPIDVQLGRDFRILVITGPNTGGKTVGLKTVGLLTLMANYGMFIPAQEESSVPFIDHIFVEIGDEQSIVQNLSTFSAHIKNIRYILKKMTPSSLVLIDEIGSGTDPRDGSSLAVAITEQILERGAYAVITSHLEKMKNLAFYQKEVENASVEFDIKTLSPRYRLRIGMTGKSYGLEIAKRLGIAPQIIERAKELSIPGARDYDLEKVVDRLNEEVKKHQDRKKQYDQMIFNLNRKSEELRKKERELRAVENAFKKEQGGKLLEEIRSIRKQLISLIEEAKSQQDLRKLKEKARQLEDLSSTARKMIEEAGTVPSIEYPREVPGVKKEWSFEDLEPGDRVLVKKYNQEAEILSINKEKKILSLALGSMKMKAYAEEVEPVVSKQKEKVNVSYQVSRSAGVPAIELNIIGKRRDEALREVETYVHGMSLKGGGEGAIIHGRGTGILKSAVTDYLKSSPLVSEWKTSPDGGTTFFKIK